MRKIDILANEKFNGDTKMAIFTLLSQGQSIDEYVDEFTKEESEIAFDKLIDIVAPLTFDLSWPTNSQSFE